MLPQTKRSLWCCWNKPSTPIPENDYILSFLSPRQEINDEKLNGVVIRAREEFSKIEDEAQKLYRDLVAGIGIVPYKKNITFRQVLGRGKKISRWWLHPVSAKNCEYDPTYYNILSILTIISVTQEYQFEVIILVDAPPPTARILGQSFVTTEIHTGRNKFRLPIVLHSLGVRFVSACQEYIKIRAARRLIINNRKTPIDIVFTGFWDWSVYRDGSSGVIKDRYYVNLPDAFRSKGIESIGWFAWLDTRSGLNRPNRKAQDTVAPLDGANEIIILQKFLTTSSLIAKCMNFEPLIRYLHIKHRKAFRKAFQREKIDYYPLFKDELLRGFLNWSIPQGELVAEAVEKACKINKPSLCFTFQEHFLFSRAIYSGAKKGNEFIQCHTIQHASYNRNKTFLNLHPQLEFHGNPDACAVPHPDTVFAMGSLGRQLFLECGYADEDVVLTGSPRYDHLQSHSSMIQREYHRPLNVLIVCSLDLRIEIDMVEAICVACEGLDNISLLLRSHPDNRVECHPSFTKFAHRIEILRGSLQNDLEKADLIIFTYTTVAEEAFLRGIPVWQWLPLNYNGSALAVVAGIPRFGSVSSLRLALREIIETKKMPSVDQGCRQEVLEKLFYSADGHAALRIANHCMDVISHCNRKDNGQSL